MVQKWALLAVSVVILAASGSSSLASPPPWPFHMTIEPLTPLVKGVPIAMEVTFSLDTLFRDHPYLRDTGTVFARLFPFRDEGDTLYYESWPVQFDDTYSNSVTFPVTIPDNDVFVLEITVTCGGLFAPGHAFFITVGEPMQFTHVLIDPPMPIGDTSKSIYGERSEKIDRDTLTEAQLETKYKVLLDLKNPNHRIIAEKILGQMQEKNKSDICPTCYALDVSLKNLFKLADAGLDIGFFNPPPWSPEYKKSPPPAENRQSDSAVDEKQGVIFNKFHLPAPYGLSLDSVNVLTPSMNLPTDTPITFYIHMRNTLYAPKFGIQTGFRIYSPDGLVARG